jgi:hypothetical protein
MIEPPCLFRNIARRPIELHGPSGVSVLGPGESLQVAAMTPELAWLEQQGALSRHASAPSPAPDMPPPEPPAPEPPAQAQRNQFGAKAVSKKPENAKPEKGGPS